MSMTEIIEATGGRLLKGSPHVRVTGLSTDSRRVKRGDLFIALRGDRFDGHHFIRQAVRRGAVGAVIERRAGGDGRCVVQVKDTLRALGDIAGSWRRRFPIPVIAVTGSNGKTTTKEMIGAILSTRYRVLKTKGNFNNRIGLPLTLLSLHRRIEVAVLEMGMNIPGEIRRLAEIASPSVGVITNIGRAHLQGLGSLNRVARAKGELLEGLPPGGLAILNGDDRFTPTLARRSPAPIVRFGCGASNDVRGRQVSMEGLKGVSFSLQGSSARFRVGSPVHVSNALAAIAVGQYFGIPVPAMQRSLKRFRGAEDRMEVIRIRHRIDLINDSYNANPDSMIAALHFLKEAGRGRRRVAVLGEMLELGRFAGPEHREIGREAARVPVQLLFAAGVHAGDLAGAARRAGITQAFAFSSSDEIAARLPGFLRPNDLVLVKGSRGMRMERVVESLKRGVA